MDSPLMRSAIGFAVACGAFLTGPLCVGAAVANADLLGGGGGGIDVLGIDVLGSPTAKKSGSGTTGRVNTVSTAPSARSVVIHNKSAAPQPDSSVMPATVSAPMAEQPAVAMGAPVVEAVAAAPLPAAPLPAASPITVPPPVGRVFYPPAPEALPISPTNQPLPSRGIGPADTFSPPQRIPDSFRVGYAEHLRAADTGDLIAAALPGVAGIAGFTLAGAYAGYRQAKALQQALLAPVPTSILL